MGRKRIEHIIEDGFKKKWCKKCAVFKVCDGDHSNFVTDNGAWDGLRWICKAGDSEQCKKWGKRNQEVKRTLNKEWRKMNGKEYDRKEYQKRKADPHHQEYQRNYAREWCKRQRANNPQYKLKYNISRRLRELLQHAGGKDMNTNKYVGCSILKLQCHLENKFDEYMTWENQGTWHIDHRIPASAFDMTNPLEQKAAFHYTNLQPMWGSENIKKKNHYDPTAKVEYMKRWRDEVF